jgi:hypothetical protein
MGNIEDLSRELQGEMKNAGGKLSSLDPEQKWLDSGNNDDEGEDYPLEGELEVMKTETEKTETEKTSKTNKTDIPPAGGTEGDSFTRLTSALEKLAGNGQSAKTYTQQFAQVAIPSVVVGVTLVATYAGVTYVGSKWGRGAREQQAIDATKGLIESGQVRLALGAPQS